MTAASRHAEWFSLVEQSGPFLALPVLEEVLPQGLEVVEAGRRKRLRNAYEEWREAVDEGDPQLEALHRQWVRMVLGELLEYDDETLRLTADLDRDLAYKSPEHSWTAKPDMVVLADEQVRLLVVILRPETDLEAPLEGGAGVASPIERVTSMCRANSVRIGLVTDGERWALVNAPAGATAGHASWYARLWFQEPLTLQAFSSLLGIRRCFGPAEERLDTMLERSLEYQEEVTDTLGQQVRRAVEVLVQSLDRADEDRNRELLRDVESRELYEAGLTVMMRLVFVLCAEERGLLLLGDSVYDDCYAVSPLRAQLREEADRHGPEVLERRHDAWARLLAVFRIVHGGIDHDSLRLPALGGSLFDPDRFPFLEGRKEGTAWRTSPSEPLPIDNRTVLMLLTALQVLEQPAGAVALSYKALDVEQIGHVYEGLLEHTVARVSGCTLGLTGSSKAKNPNVALAEVESARMDGEAALVELVTQTTGRSESAVKRALGKELDQADYDRLLQAVGGDKCLAERIGPFAHLLRKDNWGDPLVYRAGALVVTLGTDRRETGTHYTPKSITEAVVEKTLEPIAYTGPAEGLPREEWALKAPTQLLDLRVCDPAMGSGAFLVQACRWIAERVVEAWAREEDAGSVVTADGTVVDEIGDRESMVPDLDERLVLARRIVAERCLYGVDMNPLAVELAKLSLWLTTLAEGRPFGFLDHNLRCGDSLVGAHRLDQLTQLRIDPQQQSRQGRLFGRRIEEAVDRAVELRSKLRATPIRDIRDVESMERLDASARARLDLPERAADRLIEEALRAGQDTRALEDSLQRLAVEIDEWFDSAREDEESNEFRLAAEPAAQYRNVPRHGGRTFHWPLQFPEVFRRDNGGFDAVIGNPPFLGNRLWRGTQGDRISRVARLVLGCAPGKIDLSVVFHRRCVQLLRDAGDYGLLAATNIAEGSAIPVGLGEIVKQGDIYYSRKGMPWPGSANVVIAIVCFRKGVDAWKGPRVADGRECERIGPRLVPEAADKWEVKPLHGAMFAFAGVDNSKGLAFVITPDHSWFESLRSEKHSLLRPYVTGDDITSGALNRVKRYALDVADCDLKEIERDWPVAHRFLMEVVKPTRTEEALMSYKGLHDRWWQFWNHRADLMRRLRKHEKFIAYSKVTKYPICMLAPTEWIYTNKVLLIDWEDKNLLSICLSTPFRAWLEAYCGGGVGVTMTLSIKESVAKYPVPSTSLSPTGSAAGVQFNDKAVEWCAEHDCGLTDLMNAIHSLDETSAEIQELRRLLSVVDDATAEAYGWQDLDLTLDFREHGGGSASDRWRYAVEPSVRTEILERLRELNRIRYESEVKGGLHGRKKMGAKQGKLESQSSRSTAQSKLDID